MKSKLLFLVLGLALASTAHAQSIGIFLDENGESCAAEVGPTPIITLHVLAFPGGSVSELTGVQFRIVGVPETWTPENAVWVSDIETALTLGNPMFTHGVADGGPGVNVVFSSCRADGDPAGDEGPIPLGRVLILGAPTPENTVLRIEKWQLFPWEICPMFTRCEIDGWATACVQGGEAALNGDSHGCGIVTAVEQTTWTEVRLLYR